MSRIPFRRKKAAHLRFGRRGEKIARRMLGQMGLDIICCNYHAPGGEIDIVARDGEVLCFVEVKTRKPSKRNRPADAVTVAKRKKLVKASQHYLSRLNRPQIAWRYDIVEIVMSRWQLHECRHWPNEFTAKSLS